MNLTTKSLLALALFSGPVITNADPMAYISIGSLTPDAPTNGNFGTVDLSTGAFTLLGNSGQDLDGLAVANGVLYGASTSLTFDSTSTTLYTINPSNGSLSYYSTVAGDLVDFGSTTSGIYGIDTNGDLIKFTGGSGEQIIGAPGGLADLFTSTTATAGLSTNAATLYFAFNSNLYTVSTTTGAATLVGNTGGAKPYAMVQIGSTLYAGEANSATFDTLNTTTGVATTGPAGSGNGIGTTFGLAPDPVPVPLPASTWLMLSGLGMLVLTGRQRITS